VSAAVPSPAPLRARELAKSYGRRVVVDGLSLDVPAGSVVGLLGPNGAGKSTTLRMLVGLIRPERGAAWLYGAAMRPGHPLLGRVGVLVDGPGLPRHQTGRRHLTDHARLGPVPRKAVAGRVTGVLAEVGLADAADRKIRAYSAGMRQRLALARALLNDPDLLILDEPGNGLDPGGLHDLRAMIHRIRDTGRTVLISTHDLAEAGQLCDHLAVVAAGRVVATGTPQQIRAGATLEAAYLRLTGHHEGTDAHR
jgi:ABC-2 type transport system ATP-binding protein